MREGAQGARSRWDLRVVREDLACREFLREQAASGGNRYQTSPQGPIATLEPGVASRYICR